MSFSTYYCSTRYCLVNLGYESIVYNPSPGSYEIRLKGGEYIYTFFDPVNNETTKREIVQVDHPGYKGWVKFDNRQEEIFHAKLVVCKDTNGNVCEKPTKSVSKSKGNIHYVDKEHSLHPAINAIDGDRDTRWKPGVFEGNRIHYW